MNWSTILSYIGTFASLIGSGPWGAIGVGVAALGVVGAAFYFITKANKERDAQDLENGGAVVGEGAVDLRNQANANRDYMDHEREEIQKEGPPKP